MPEEDAIKILKVLKDHMVECLRNGVVGRACYDNFQCALNMAIKSLYKAAP